MNFTALFVANAVIYGYIAALVAVRRLTPGRPRSVLAGAMGSVFGFVGGVAMARMFLDGGVVVLVAGVLLAVNTSAVSVIFTNPAMVEQMRLASEGRGPGDGWRGGVRSPRLLRGWTRLSATWKVADLLAMAWIVLSALITLRTSAAGDPLPTALRAVDAALTIGAWVTVGVAMVKAWHLGRAAEEEGVEAGPRA